MGVCDVVGLRRQRETLRFRALGLWTRLLQQPTRAGMLLGFLISGSAAGNAILALGSSLPPSVWAAVELGSSFPSLARVLLLGLLL